MCGFPAIQRTATLSAAQFSTALNWGLLHVCGTLSNCVPLYVKEFEKSFHFEGLHRKIFGVFSIMISETSRLLLFLVCKGTNHKCNDTYLD